MHAILDVLQIFCYESSFPNYINIYILHFHFRVKCFSIFIIIDSNRGLTNSFQNLMASDVKLISNGHMFYMPH
jgi:hypothetical protein